MLEVMTDSHTDNVYAVSTVRGETAPIPSVRGVRQGGPLSAIVFNLVMEVLLRGASGLLDTGYRFACALGGTAVVRRYTDDTCLCAASRRQLQAQSELCHLFSKWSGMEFKPTKCCVLATAYQDGGSV